VALNTPVLFVVHGKAQALDALAAAAEAGVTALLLSGRSAGIYAGPGWFLALIESARSRYPSVFGGAILDCGDDAGAVLAAIRAGVPSISFAGRTALRRRLNEIATARGVSLGGRGSLWRRALDLDRIIPERRQVGCAKWIAGRAERR
jgi:hypothetical protein